MKYLFFVIGLFWVQLAFAQQAMLTFQFASKQSRDSVSFQLQQQVERTFVLPLNNTTYDQWMGAFWAMELMLYKPVGYKEIIPAQITQLPNLGPGFQRSFFEMLYTLYPGGFSSEVELVW